MSTRRGQICVWPPNHSSTVFS